MFNSGFKASEIDGTEFIFEEEKSYNIDTEIPVQFSYMKNLPPVLDQGSDPICVPCSISAFLEYKLSMSSGDKKTSHFKLFDIFNSRTTLGEGMTCKEAFKYVIDKGAKYKNGIIKAEKYFMIRNTQALRHAVFANGPCICVLPVYDDSLDNFWQKTKNLIGYHAVAVIGYDTNGFIIRNSWGDSYGIDGYNYITDEDIHKAIEIWTLI